MSAHCNKYPGCGCPPECGERCHIVDLGSPETVGDLLDKLNEIPFNADFGFRNQPAQTLHYDSIKVSCYFEHENSVGPDAVSFLEWVANNWYVPTIDCFWRVEVENPEYEGETPVLNWFTEKELYEKFANKEGCF